MIRSDHGAYHVIPGMLFVVDDGGPQTPSRVDAGSSDGDGCQMNQEHCKPNGERSQNLQFNAGKIKGVLFSDPICNNKYHQEWLKNERKMGIDVKETYF